MIVDNATKVVVETYIDWGDGIFEAKLVSWVAKDMSETYYIGGDGIPGYTPLALFSLLSICSALIYHTTKKKVSK